MEDAIYVKGFNSKGKFICLEVSTEEEGYEIIDNNPDLDLELVFVDLDLEEENEEEMEL